MNLYIDYSEFELTCWNTDGKGTNVAIPLTEEQARDKDKHDISILESLSK